MLTTLRTFMVDRLARSIQKAVAFNENLYSSLISPEVIFRHSRMSHFDQPTVASRFIRCPRPKWAFFERKFRFISIYAVAMTQPTTRGGLERRGYRWF